MFWPRFYRKFLASGLSSRTTTLKKDEAEAIKCEAEAKPEAGASRGRGQNLWGQGHKRPYWARGLNDDDNYYNYYCYYNWPTSPKLLEAAKMKLRSLLQQVLWAKCLSVRQTNNVSGILQHWQGTAVETAWRKCHYSFAINCLLLAKTSLTTRTACFAVPQLRPIPFAPWP